MTTQYDVVVVGGGLAGMVAAIEAADVGARVALLDARGRLGGRARSDEIAGVLHNVGPHALFRRGVAARELRRVGVRFAGRTPTQGVRFVLGGEVVRGPSRGDRSPTARALLRAARAAGDPGLDRIPLAGWLGEQRLDPDSRAFLEAAVRISTYVDAPDRFSAGAAFRQLRTAFTGGIWYLHGGWASLVTALRQRLDDRGVQVETGAPVDSLERDGATWLIRTADDRAFATRAVVVAAGGPALAERLLGVEPGRWAGDPVEASVLDVIVDAHLRHRSLFSVDEPLYLATHCPPARLATGGDAILATAMRYLGPGDRVAPPAEIRGGLEAHLRAAAGREVAPVHTRYLHRLTVAGGLPDAARGGLRGRPAATVEDRPGAFLAGDWVGPEGLLADAAVASGVASGRAAAAVALGTAVGGAVA